MKKNKYVICIETHESVIDVLKKIDKDYDIRSFEDQTFNMGRDTNFNGTKKGD